MRSLLLLLSCLPVSAAITTTTICTVGLTFATDPHHCDLGSSEASASASLGLAGGGALLNIDVSAEAHPQGATESSAVSVVDLDMRLRGAGPGRNGVLLIVGSILRTLDAGTDASAAVTFAGQHFASGTPGVPVLFDLFVPVVIGSEIVLDGLVRTALAGTLGSEGLNSVSLTAQFRFFELDRSTPVGLSIIDPDVVIPEPSTLVVTLAGLFFFAVWQLRRAR